MRLRLLTASVAAALAAVALLGCAPDVPGASGGAPSSTVEPTVTSAPSPTTTPDPYAGYFDDRPQDGPAFASFRGSFGDVGAVAPVRNELRTLPAGRYDLEVVCVGPPDGVDVVLTSLGDGAELRAVNVGCTAEGVVGRTDTIEMPAGGLAVDLDSGGDPGAYVVTVRDPAA